MSDALLERMTELAQACAEATKLAALAHGWGWIGVPVTAHHSRDQDSFTLKIGPIHETLSTEASDFVTCTVACNLVAQNLKCPIWELWFRPGKFKWRAARVLVAAEAMATVLGPEAGRQFLRLTNEPGYDKWNSNRLRLWKLYSLTGSLNYLAWKKADLRDWQANRDEFDLDALCEVIIGLAAHESTTG